MSKRSRNNYQNEDERRRNKARMEGFDQKTSHAYAVLCKRFGPKLSQQELLALAQVVSENLKIQLDREASRRKSVLIKWFDENFAKMESFLANNVMVTGEKDEPIGGNPRDRTKG